MNRPRLSTLIRRHLFASSEKPPKLDAQIPASLLHTRPLEDAEAWFKALVKHLRKEIGLKGAPPKVSVVENIRSGSQTIQFGLSKRIPLQADLTLSGKLTQNLRGKLTDYEVSTREGLQRYYRDMIQAYAQEEALLAWLPTITDKLQAYTGLGLSLSLTEKGDYYYGTWRTLSNPALDVSVQLKTLVDGTDISWTLHWQEEGSAAQVNTSNSLAVILENIPEEYDSEMVWFTSDAKQKELKKTLKKVLNLKRPPQVWSDDQGSGGVLIKDTITGRLAKTQYTIDLDYRNQKQEWSLFMAAKTLKLPLFAGGINLEEIQETLRKDAPVYEFLKESVEEVSLLNVMAYTDSTEYLNVEIEAYRKENSLEEVIERLSVLDQCVQKLIREPFVMYEQSQRVARLVTRHIFANTDLKPIKTTKLSGKLAQGPRSNHAKDVEDWFRAVLNEAKKSLGIPKVKLTAEVLQKDANTLKVSLEGPEGIRVKANLDVFGEETLYLLSFYKSEEYDLSKPSEVQQWYVEEVLRTFSTLASIQWLKTILPRLQAAVGVSFSEHIYFLSHETPKTNVTGVWQDIEKRDVKITISTTLETQKDFSVRQDWSLSWIDPKGGNQSYHADNIEDLLLELPSEFDSESVFFTDKRGLANLKDKIKQSLGPGVKIDVRKQDFTKTLKASIELRGELTGYEHPPVFYGILKFDGKASSWAGNYNVKTKNFLLVNRLGRPMPHMEPSHGYLGKYPVFPAGAEGIVLTHDDPYQRNLEDLLYDLEDFIKVIRDLADQKVTLKI